MSPLPRTRIAATGAGLLLALVPAGTAAAAAAPANLPRVTAGPGGCGLPASLDTALGALGLSARVVNGCYLAATGPAAIVAQACTTLGTGLGDGAVAVYTGPGETGEGGILFTGDNPL